MAIRFLKFAIVYLMLGVAMGVAMGVTHHFEYAPVHAHINLLGWVSLGLVRDDLSRLSAGGADRLARWHFWLHVIGLPIFMIGLFLLSQRRERGSGCVAIGAAITFVGLVLFAVNLMRTLAAAHAPARSSGTAQARARESLRPSRVVRSPS